MGDRVYGQRLMRSVIMNLDPFKSNGEPTECHKRGKKEELCEKLGTECPIRTG